MEPRAACSSAIHSGRRQCAASGCTASSPTALRAPAGSPHSGSITTVPETRMGRGRRGPSSSGSGIRLPPMRSCGRARDAGRLPWIGLRLGATIAAIASSRAVQPPTRLLLWEPVVDGPAWLAELEASHRQEITRAYAWVKGRPNPAQASLTKPLRESVGFPLPDALLAELAALRPTVFSGAACRELICLSSRPPEVAIRSWNSSRHGQSGEAVWRQVSETNWNSDEAMNSAIVPADVIATIMEELART